MVIRNEASKNKVTYMRGKPTKEDMAKYYNTSQITLMLNEMQQILGAEETIKYLKNRIKVLKSISKEGK